MCVANLHFHTNCSIQTTHTQNRTDTQNKVREVEDESYKMDIEQECVKEREETVRGNGEDLSSFVWIASNVAQIPIYRFRRNAYYSGFVTTSDYLFLFCVTEFPHIFHTLRFFHLSYFPSMAENSQCQKKKRNEKREKSRKMLHVSAWEDVGEDVTDLWNQKLLHECEHIYGWNRCLNWVIQFHIVRRQSTHSFICSQSYKWI